MQICTLSREPHGFPIATYGAIYSFQDHLVVALTTALTYVKTLLDSLQNPVGM